MNEDLICEIQAAIALSGWQGLADRPDLVERLLEFTPAMDEALAGDVREIYRLQQAGLRVVVSAAS